MTINKRHMGPRLGLTVILLGALAGCQHFAGSDDRPIVQNMEQPNAASPAAQEKHDTATLAAVPEATGHMAATAPTSGLANSRVQEVRTLIQTRAVRELRTTYNGNYGASLLFKPDSLTYYAVLFENRNVWRVLKTDDSDRAEKTYSDYVSESERLAQADIDRIRLEAQYNSIEDELLAKADELTALQHDLEIEHQQEMVIKSHQAQVRSDVELLSRQEEEAREQLRVLQRQIESLQEQRRR